MNKNNHGDTEGMEGHGETWRGTEEHGGARRGMEEYSDALIIIEIRENNSFINHYL